MSNNMRTAIVTGGGSGIGQAVGVALAPLAGPWSLPVEKWRRLSGPGNSLRALDWLRLMSPMWPTTLRSSNSLMPWSNGPVASTTPESTCPRYLSSNSARQSFGRSSRPTSWARFFARAAFRVMKAQTPQSGRIINNGSVSAYAPRPNSAPYTATKHGITGLTKSLVLDGRAFNIACGQIDIGNATTDMSARMATGAMQANGTTMVEPRIPAKLVAEAIVHMANLPLEANIPFVTIIRHAALWSRVSRRDQSAFDSRQDSRPRLSEATS